MKKILTFILLLFAIQAFALAPFALSKDMDSVYAADKVTVFIDNENNLTVEDFLQKRVDFSKSIAFKETSSLKKNTYWFCIEADNQTREHIEWTLSNPRTNGGNIEAYHILNGQVIDTKKGKALRPYLQHPSVSYTVVTPAKAVSKILVRINFDNAGFIYPQFIVDTPQNFARKQMNSIMFKSLCVGGILIVFIYNLFLLFSLRTRAYAWYSVYIISVIVFTTGANGMGYEYIWNENDFFSRYSFAIIYPMLFILALQFSRVFLQTKENCPRLDKALQALILLYVVLFILALSLSMHKEFALKLFHISSIAMCFLPFLGLYAWLHGHKEARWYALAWGGWVIGFAPVILVAAGANIDHEVAENMVRFGLWFEAALLSFALADQINILKVQRNEAILNLESQREMMEFQSRLAQMGEMIAAIGHQWKQPLSGLYLIVQDLQDAYAHGELSAKYINSSVERSMELIEYMSKTIDDFKKFFSPNKIKSDFVVRESIDSIRAMVGSQYTNEGIEFEFLGSQTAKIRGRENEFKQVLVNIFNNAKDVFTERETPNRKITVDISEQEQAVTIKIGDNAGGISPENIDRIFGQYFTTKGEKGTGIGLYICKIVIEKSFGGTICIKNENDGAQFVITVPQEVTA